MIKKAKEEKEKETNPNFAKDGEKREKGQINC